MQVRDSRPRLEPATEPLVAGDTLYNPVTGKFGVLVKGSWEGDDRSFPGTTFGRRAATPRAGSRP